MKALAKLHSEKGIWMTECEKPTVGHNDLLIKIVFNQKIFHPGTGYHFTGPIVLRPNFSIGLPLSN